MDRRAIDAVACRLVAHQRRHDGIGIIDHGRGFEFPRWCQQRPADIVGCVGQGNGNTKAHQFGNDAIGAGKRRLGDRGHGKLSFAHHLLHGSRRGVDIRIAARRQRQHGCVTCRVGGQCRSLDP